MKFSDISSLRYNLPETKDVALAEMYQTIKAFGLDSGDGEDRVDMLEAWEDPFDQVELFQISDFPFNMEVKTSLIRGNI